MWTDIARQNIIKAIFFTVSRYYTQSVKYEFASRNTTRLRLRLTRVMYGHLLIGASGGGK
jgi:hypothetical protein